MSEGGETPKERETEGKGERGGGGGQGRKRSDIARGRVDASGVADARAIDGDDSNV